MVRTFARVVLTATAVAGTLLAGLAIIFPVGVPADRSTAATRTVVVFALPQSTAVGISVALGAALVLANLRRALISWGSALAGAAIMLANHTVFVAGTLGTSLTSLNYLDSTAGGLLLAGVTIGMRPGRAQFAGWVVGAIGAIWAGGTPPGTHFVGPSPTSRLVDWAGGESPPRSLMVLTIVLILVCAWFDRLRADLTPPTYELPVAPLLAGVAIVTQATTVPDWLTRHSHSDLAIALAVLAEILAISIAALLLPGRDGCLVLVVGAMSACAYAVQAPLAEGVVAVGLAALAAAAVLLALRRQNPNLAMGLGLAVAVFSALTYSASPENRLHAILLGVAMSVAGGYAFGSCRVTFRPVRVIALAVMYLPSVTSGLRAGRQPVFGPNDLNPDRGSITGAPPAGSAAPAIAGLAIALGCTVVLLLLQRLRPVTQPTATTTPVVADE
ncbi:hypothetical protein [Nocardia stercoris]|uniref:MFS transporter n=1 Tax=Nocardia stercoris TaxID=2483361 RepID=A0A3M2L041_9NOCA|nr:hypothetical protein [Nocardia stercoris]RMI29883.1 hypothetical protein EBN03_24120 [Nocardia stercoris]